MDMFEIIRDYIAMHGQLLFGAFGLGVSFYVNRTLSGVLLTYSLICFVLFYFFSNSIFLALAGLSVVLGFFLKNQGM